MVECDKLTEDDIKYICLNENITYINNLFHCCTCNKKNIRECNIDEHIESYEHRQKRQIKEFMTNYERYKIMLKDLKYNIVN
jgi:hypothetical protein